MRDQTTALRQRLRHSWIPFFARFGKLTPVQIETIPKVLEGANVVVASPTATGKTEAVLAPVAERFVSERWTGLAVLYVVPTRALANDTLGRIGGPLEDMGLQSALKHGDRPYLSKQLPNCLVTTPESLDSLICRHPEAFRQLRVIILDEIHLLDNTYRGDQLRLLLWRLRKLVSQAELSTHLLSATLSEPHRVAKRYLDKFEVVTTGGTRGIDYQVLDSHEEVWRLVRSNGYKKVLYFCNLRESVEAVASQIVPLWRPYPVLVHHGSLSRQLREETESAMKEARVAACVATSTLEIGIDIGDIDLIVLAEAPWSIASLIQRVGRGNRRESTIRVAAIAHSPEERILLEAMLDTASSGLLPPEPYQPDYSVAVQQIFSLLYQHRDGVAEEVLLELVGILLGSNQAASLLQHLQSCGWIHRVGRVWVASTALIDMGDRGQIHSNIPSSETYKVLDIDSGAMIGTVAGTVDEVFVLARRAWQIQSVSEGTIRVRRFKGQASAALFGKHRNIGAFHRLLPPQLR